MTGELGRGIRDAVALAPWQIPNDGGFFSWTIHGK